MYERTYKATVLKHDDKSPKRKPFPWKLLGIIAGVGVLMTGIVFVVRVPKFQVRSVTVVGTNVAEPSDVSQFVLGRLQGTYLGILPKTSIFLISRDKVTQAIKRQFPRFKTVTLTRDGVASLKVSVTEYPGVYLWCDTNDVCSFMDETGTVFADAPYFSGSAYLKIYIGDRSPYPFHPITAAQIALLSMIKDRLTTMDIIPLSFSFVSDHNLTMEFIHATTHPTVLFDPTGDIDTALQTLYTGLHTEPLASLYRNQSKVLEYLDVRFANKLVYKFQ